jgi:hypothetical protein
MLFPKRPRSRYQASSKRERHSRRRSQRDAAFIPSPICCGPTAELLEERTMLSAVVSVTAAPASPTYIINPNVKPQTSPGNQGYTPQQVQTAYALSTGTVLNNNISFDGLPGNGKGATIAIVDAFNDPNIVGDVGAFSTEFGLQQFNTGGPTFQVLNEDGGTSLSGIPDGLGWDVEESLDVEWVHSMAPQANIILFEAADNENGLYTAEQTAAEFPGVSVVSNSWGGDEFDGEQDFDSDFTTPAGHQGVTFLVASGDHGSPANYPATSPNVVAVGGTYLQIQSNGTYISESVWNNGIINGTPWATSGGPSALESIPSYQAGIDGANGASTTFRNDNDVAADADPNSGVWVYDSYSSPPGEPWGVVGGTSLACPLWAGMIGIADQGRSLAGLNTLDGPSQTLPMLYDMSSSQLASNLHDITAGSNGTYSAATGYDFDTGLGTPIANEAVWYLAGYDTPPQISVPSLPSLTEDTSLVFSSSNNTEITVSDPFAGTGIVDATFATSSVQGPNGPESGALDLTNTTGLTFVSGQNDSNQFEVSGTLASLNADLNGLTFQPPAGFVGFDLMSLQVATTQQPVESSTANINLDIVATNSPSFSAPLGVSVDENSSLSFTGGDNISLFDTGATGSTTEDVTVSVSNGTLEISPTTGVNISSDGTGSVTATGTLSDIDTALASLVYTPTANYYGSDSLTLHDEDTADNLTGSASVPITVLALAPAINAPTAVGVVENKPFDFNNSNVIVVSDLSGTSEQMTLTVSDGTLSLTTTGLTGESGVGTASVTLTGSLSNLDSDLATLVYTPNTGYSGPDTLNLSDLDTVDNLSTTAAVSITVASSPTIVGPTGATLMENGSLTFSSTNGNEVSFADPFAGGNADTFTLTVSEGTLTLPSTGGLSFTTGANGDASFTVTGTVNAMNSDLNGLVYTPINGYYGTDSLALSVSDPGNNLSGNGSVTLAITPIAPTLSSPSAAVVDENQPLTFSNSNNDGIVLSDINSGGDSLSLSVANGTLTLPETTGLTFTTGANTSASFTVSGSISALNDALNGLVYQPNTNYYGSDALEVTVTNLTDKTSASSGVEISVLALPTVVAPGSANVTENTAYTFSTAFGNEISVTDQVAGSNFDALTLSASDGTLTLGETSGVTVTSGSYGSNSFTVVGLIGDLNAALNDMTYQPDYTYTGKDTLSVTLKDPTDNLSALSDVSLSINAVTAPSISGPSTASVNENSSLTFSATKNTLTLADNGAGSNPDTETLSVSHGTLTFGQLAGVIFTNGSNGSSTFTVKATVGNFNAALDSLTYQPTFGYAGSDSLSITVVDPGDSKSGSDSVALTVIALAPTITAPGSASMNENGSLPFSPANGNGITLADANPGTDSLTLTVGHGTLTLATTNGLTVTSGANGSNTMTVTGSATNLNAAVNGVTYKPTSGYTGTDSLSIALLDTGNGESATASVLLSIVGFSPPTITAPATGLLAENSSLVFSSGNGNAISLGDTGIGSGSDSLTLSVSHGTLTLAATTGLTFTAGNNGSSSFTVSGNLANLNGAVNGLKYVPGSGYSGSDSLKISISDAGDGQSASTSVALTISTYLSPTISGPSGVVVSENGELVFSTTTNNAITLADTGPGSSSDSLTLSVSHGILTLASTAGLTVTSGANGSAAVTVTGSVANLNAALNGVVYEPGASYIGTDLLAVSLKDAGDSLSASANVNINVAGLTAPAIKAPASVSAKGTFTFTGTLAISITDPNANASSVEQLLIKATGGTLSLSKTTGLTFTSGANNSLQMIVQGTLANLNAAVATLSYSLSGSSQTITLVYTNLQDALQGTAAIIVSAGVTKLGAASLGTTSSSPATTSTPSTTSTPAVSTTSTTSSPSGSASTPASTSSVATTGTSSSSPVTSTTDEDSTSSDILYKGLLAAVDVLVG